MLSVKKTLMGASVVVLCSASSSWGADILVPPPVVPDPEPCCVTGFYLRGDVGFAAVTDGDFRHDGVSAAGGSFISEDINNAGYVDVGVGYNFNSWFRADVTAEFRGSQKFSAVDNYQFDCDQAGLSSGSCGEGGVITRNNVWNGTVNTMAFWLTGYVDFDLGCSFLCGLTPYVGASIGIARHSIDGLHEYDPSDLGGGSYAKDKDQWKAAYALHAGLGYAVSDALTVELGYRYAYWGDIESGNLCGLPGCGQELKPLHIEDLATHDFKIGLRWDLGGPKYISDPEPLPTMGGYNAPVYKGHSGYKSSNVYTPPPAPAPMRGSNSKHIKDLGPAGSSYSQQNNLF